MDEFRKIHGKSSGLSLERILEPYHEPLAQFLNCDKI